MLENKKWREIIIQCEDKHEDLVYSTLYDFNINTFEIIDYKTYIHLKNNKPDWVILDDNIMKNDKKIIIKIYLDISEYKPGIVNELVNKILEIDNKLIIETNKYIEDSDWSKEWKKHYKPFKIGNNIVIKPSWEEFDNNENNIIIEIDPGMAFGTGTHETTSLCLEVLEKLELDNRIVYDIGSGSGILSIASAKLGAKKVIAIDIDPISVKATVANSRMNKTDRIISVFEGDLLNSMNLKGDIIIANILPDVIIKLIPDVKKLINNDGLFLVSGILKEKSKKVINFINDNNFKVLDIIEKGEWVCILSRINNESIF